MQNVRIPWSDKWWLENEKAWFCAGQINALFCVDMNSRKCEYIAKIPEGNINSSRLYPYCAKYENTVFCLPGWGKYIWCYDLDKSVWNKIEIGQTNQLLMYTNSYNQKKSELWLLEDKTRNIYEINLKKKLIEKKYHISHDGNAEYCEYIIVQNKLYCVYDRIVYCVDMDNSDINKYEISCAKAALCTICYDGVNFWLSGYCKEIYVWNPDYGVVKVITEFPKQFGIYHFKGNELCLLDCDSFLFEKSHFFFNSIFLGKYIWFIPFQSNEIIYIDKVTYQVNVLEIAEEQETEESLAGRLESTKYYVEYIRDNRYIGLYSFKNQLVFEIDTVELKAENRNYALSDEAIHAIKDEYIKSRAAFREKSKVEQQLFNIALEDNRNKAEESFQNVGKLIYYSTVDN